MWRCAPPHEKTSRRIVFIVQQLKRVDISSALYSELARKLIVKARKIIQRLGIKSDAESIKEFRKRVLDGELEDLLELPNFGRDFYTLSEFRDLCFHVKEHRFTIESLNKLLNCNGLTFCGFILPEQIKALYQEQYPEDSDMTSLTNWGKFEEENPSTFRSMYQFWAQKS